LAVNMLNSVFLPCIASSLTSTSCFQVNFYYTMYITTDYYSLSYIRIYISFI
jgi:hypothetical protein